MALKSDITLKAITSIVKIDAQVACQFAQGVIDWQDIMATEIFLDPQTLNQYIRNETFSVLDQPSLETQKTFADSLSGFTDDHVKEIQKGLSDALSFSDQVDVFLIIQRNFSDSVSVSDVTAIAIDKPLTESLTLGELVSILYESTQADSYTISDTSATLHVTKNVADSVLFADTFSHVVTFNRFFSDAFTLDDTTTVDAISKAVDADKTNIFSLGDTQTIVFDKSPTDGFALSDSQQFSVTKALSDSLSLSENVSFVLLGDASAVLNTSALNTYTLNS